MLQNFKEIILYCTDKNFCKLRLNDLFCNWLFHVVQFLNWLLPKLKINKCRVYILDNYLLYHNDGKKTIKPFVEQQKQLFCLFFYDFLKISKKWPINYNLIWPIIYNLFSIWVTQMCLKFSDMPKKEYLSNQFYAKLIFYVKTI